MLSINLCRDPNATPALILVGGFGTRLRPLVRPMPRLFGGHLPLRLAQSGD